MNCQLNNRSIASLYKSVPDQVGIPRHIKFLQNSKDTTAEILSISQCRKISFVPQVPQDQKIINEATLRTLKMAFITEKIKKSK